MRLLKATSTQLASSAGRKLYLGGKVFSRHFVKFGQTAVELRSLLTQLIHFLVHHTHSHLATRHSTWMGWDAGTAGMQVHCRNQEHCPNMTAMALQAALMLSKPGLTAPPAIADEDEQDTALTQVAVFNKPG